jgi:phage shock protein PspC (stress-responsive transcriptional regulator)
MKKIININLSGRVIPIEDAAYENLQEYIESLRKYFAKEEGRDEIINDIESRIAELMNDKIRKGSDAVTEADVKEIIASMGRIEDFEAADAEEFSKTNSSAQSAGSSYNYNAGSGSTFAGSSYTKTKSRLYRDTSDKLIGGVCSGISNYLNIDPAIIRLLFAIITFGGFGFGFLVYIILWIVLPTKDLDQYSGKRLYRNPEERVLGGVASGLAAYFGKDVWPVRLIFAAPLILNIAIGLFSWPFFHEGSFFPNIVFGSISGTFVLAYIILWIVLPEARTTYQQMEMRGEKVDINKIKQTVQDRAKEFGEEVKTAAQSFSEKAKTFANTRGKTFANEFNDAARRTSGGIGHIIGVLFKAFFLFIAGTIAFALFVTLLAMLMGGIGVWPIKNFVLDGFWQNTFAWGTLVFFLGIPLIAFIVWLVRRIMRVRSRSSYLGWTFGGLWTIGWICVTFLAASLTKEFRMGNYKRPGTELAITQPLNNRMLVKVSEPEVEYSGAFPWINIDGNGFDITQDTLKISNIKIRVLKSEDANYHVEIKKYSRGETTPEAEARAQKIQYNATYRDSVLDLGSGLAIDKESKFRFQHVEVVISVPVGKKINFDNTIKDKLYVMNLNINEGRSWRNRKVRNDWNDWDFDWNGFDYDTDVDYVMSENGELINPAKPAEKNLTNPDEYRYDDNNKPTKDEIKEQERKVEEENRRLQEMKKQEVKDTIKKQASFINNEEEENNEESTGDVELFPMVKMFY